MNQNKIRRSNWIGGVLFGLFATSVLLLSFGCDKKKSNGAPVTVGFIGGIGQPGYNGYGTVQLNAGGIEVMQRYFLMASIATKAPYPGVGNVPAMVSGELRVYEGMACASNYNYGLNRGTYQLLPADANMTAVLNFNSINNVRLIARAPGIEAIVRVPFGFFYGNLICGGLEGMQGQMIVESINRSPCNLQTFFDNVEPYGFCGP